MKEFVGTLNLGNKVDITDPCYNKNVWCRMTVDCEPGLYNGYVTLSDEGEWGERVSALWIIKDGVKCDVDDMKPMGFIGVDAGMAGFFNNKKDFDDDDWAEFCNQVSHGSYWNLFDGIFCTSGYGDGMYDVYTNENNNAFAIVFINEE